MKTVELYAHVRYAVQIEGLSHREAARRFGIDPKTVAKMMRFSVPPGYRRTKPPAKPKLDPFLPVIDKILADDKERPKKQQHTSKRIFERLRDEHGYTGGITIVKDYVAGSRQRSREMFVPLTHPPGHAQADFGEALAVIGGTERKIHFFAFDLPHSDACFVIAYPAETTEAFCDGHVKAFEFFGGVRVVDTVHVALFIFFVATEKPYWWFLLLFCGAVLNRESAFFIAPWLVLQPFVDGRYATAKWRNALSGVALVCVGVGFILTVRYMLLIEEVAPPVTGQPYGRHFQWVYSDNWHVIFLRLTYPFSTNVVPALFWVASYFVAALVALRNPRKFGLMSLCFVTLLSGVLAFGVMMETRILLEFVPLLTLGSLIASGAYRKPEQVGTQR